MSLPGNHLPVYVNFGIIFTGINKFTLVKVMI
jgi:hypothetical protein